MFKRPETLQRSLVFLLAACSIAVITACTTTSENVEDGLFVDPTTGVAERRSLRAKPAQRSSDVGLLQRTLGMDRAPRELGYEEKSFDPCVVGFEDPSGTCALRTLVVIQFLAQCRDSEGTVSVMSSMQIAPLASQKVRWSIGSLKGETATDDEGYGQIVALSGGSMKTQKVRLTINGRFMILEAGELRRVVAPRPWCAAI